MESKHNGWQIEAAAQTVESMTSSFTWTIIEMFPIHLTLCKMEEANILTSVVPWGLVGEECHLPVGILRLPMRMDM